MAVTKKRKASAALPSRFENEAVPEVENTEFMEGLGLEEEDGSFGLKKEKRHGGSFQTLGLYAPLLRAIQRKGYKQPTPIQRRTLPLLLDGRDVVAMARTGSGKTLSFVLPMLHKLKAHSAQVGARALILAPSRELALQTLGYIKDMAKYTDLRAVVLLGGDSMESQFDALLTNPDIIVATPGRLLHLLEETKMELGRVTYLVLDEADRLFELGLAAQLTQIMALLPAAKQTGLFSATLPPSLVTFTGMIGLRTPEFVRLNVEDQLSPDLETWCVSLKPQDKEAALVALLSSPWSPLYSPQLKAPIDGSLDHHARPNRMDLAGGMIFVSTKHHVEYLHELFTRLGWRHGYLYGTMDPEARKQALEDFRAAGPNASVLIVTDVAARGLDVPFLSWVLHYDYPAKEKLFVHRAGRVARAGRPGKAVAFVAPEDLPYLMDLGVYLDRKLVLATNKAEVEGDPCRDLMMGRLPTDALSEAQERLGALMAANDGSSLSGLKRVTQNALKLYHRTKSVATPAGYAAAKAALATGGLDASLGLLPFCADVALDGPAAAGKADLLAKIRGFRPTETVFEAMKRGVRGQGATPDAMLALLARRRAFKASGAAKKAHRLEQAKSHGSEDDDFEAGEADDGRSVAGKAAIESSSNEVVQFKFDPEAKEAQPFFMSYMKGKSHLDRALEVDRDASSSLSNPFHDAFRSALSEAAFDVTASRGGMDPLAQLQQQQQQPGRKHVWDKKKKKFVWKDAPREKIFETAAAAGLSKKKDKRERDDDKKKKQKHGKKDAKHGKGAATVGATKKAEKLPGDMYREWQKRKHVSLPRVGGLEVKGAGGKQGDEPGFPTDRKDYRGAHLVRKRRETSLKARGKPILRKERQAEHRGSSHSGGQYKKGGGQGRGSGGARNELKPAEHVLKVRKTKVLQAERFKPSKGGGGKSTGGGNSRGGAGHGGRGGGAFARGGRAGAGARKPGRK